jgi:hypothetical protein
MRIAITDGRKGRRDPAASITVAYRNMIELRKALNADMYVNAHEYASAPSDYDAIICGFGSVSCECDKQLDFIKRNKFAALYWLVGEYEQSTFAPLFYACRDQGRKVHIIRNYAHDMRCSYASKQSFVDFNALLARRPNQRVGKDYGCVYWGRWRPDRAVYFRRYLHQPLRLSTSPKNMKHYIHAGCTATLGRAMSWQPGLETLNLFSHSLYIEDVFTHTHYNCLANRFYEAAYCNVAQWFDASCRNTIERSGIPFCDDWYVDSHAALVRKISPDKYADAMAGQSAWAELAMDKKSDALARIADIVGAPHA